MSRLCGLITSKRVIVLISMTTNSATTTIRKYISLSWHAADNIKLEQLLSQLWHPMYVGFYAKENTFCSNEGHRSIIRSIEDRNVETAQRATEAHRLFSLKDMKERRLYQKSIEGTP